jgi:hypothetical protein
MAREYLMTTMFMPLLLVTIVNPLLLGASAHPGNFQGSYYTLDWDGKHYHVGYNITAGGQIDQIILRDHHFEIRATAQSDGEMFLTIPRMLFTNVWLEPYYAGYYESIQVSDANGDIVNVAEKLADCHSIDIKVPVHAGSNTINIIADSGSSEETRTIGGYYMTYPLAVGSEQFVIPIRTNSYHCDLQFRIEEKSLIVIVFGGPARWEGEVGFLEVTIPHRLLDGNYSMQIDGESAKVQSKPDNMTNSTRLQVQYDVEDFSLIRINGTQTLVEQPVQEIATQIETRRDVAGWALALAPPITVAVAFIGYLLWRQRYRKM